MMYLSAIKTIKPMALMLMLMGLPLLGATNPVAAQECEDQIQGTVEVTQGADLSTLATITFEEAREAALAAEPGATLVGVELDVENGYLVYSVELAGDGTEIELLIDAGSAEVLCTEREAEDGEDDDGWPDFG